MHRPARESARRILAASKGCIIFVRISEDRAMPKTPVPLSPRGRGARGEGASR